MMAFLYLLGAFLAAFAFIFPVLMFWFRDSLLDNIIRTLVVLGIGTFFLIVAYAFRYFSGLFMGEING